MPNLSDEINKSEARKILQKWLHAHKIASGEQLQDIAKKLTNEHGQPLGHPAVSPWFSYESKQAKLMPVNRAMELKSFYTDFPLKDYLRAFIDFHEQYNTSDEKLSGVYAFIEAYGEIVGYGYWAQDLSEYLSIFSEVENLFSTSLPQTLTDDQKNILRQALEKIMLKEIEYENTAEANLS